MEGPNSQANLGALDRYHELDHPDPTKRAFLVEPGEVVREETTAVHWRGPAAHFVRVHWRLAVFVLVRPGKGRNHKNSGQTNQGGDEREDVEDGVADRDFAVVRVL